MKTLGTDPNIAALELAAQELRSLLTEFVLVGGCAVGLLITDGARPPVRHTRDVDLITEVTPLKNYYALCAKLRDLGFKESSEIICRWTKGDLIVDVMPTDEGVLSFTNRWYELAVKTALISTLPSGLQIRHVSGPLLIATKIESFYGRGNGDYRHHDIEDIVNVVDGRPELFDEIRNAPVVAREFIEQEFDDLLAQSKFVESLSWHLRPDASEQGRIPLIIERLRQIAGL